MTAYIPPKFVVVYPFHLWKNCVRFHPKKERGIFVQSSATQSARADIW